ncbi:MAG: hypothetical protein H5T91_07465 [Synergistetes bacterium]|nr:hypothetical protein [Synergistota bacterium]
MEAVDFVRLGFSSGAKVSLSFDEFCGRDRIDAIYSMLRSKDPQLGKNFLVFATFLKHIAPDLLEGFLDMVENVLRAEGESRRGNISVLKSSFSFKLDFKMVVTEKDISKDEVFTNLSLKLSFDFRTTVQVKNIDPILLDMNGNGIKLTGLNDPVLFDIDGDGVEERVSFVEGDDAFLFLDLNMNKFLDGGWELVGDNGGWSNGFELLRAFDFNRDGKINPEEPF